MRRWQLHADGVQRGHGYQPGLQRGVRRVPAGDVPEQQHQYGRRGIMHGMPLRLVHDWHGLHRAEQLRGCIGLLHCGCQHVAASCVHSRQLLPRRRTRRNRRQRGHGHRGLRRRELQRSRRIVVHILRRWLLRRLDGLELMHAMRRRVVRCLGREHRVHRVPHGLGHGVHRSHCAGQLRAAGDLLHRRE